MKYVCPVCGYVHIGDSAPEKCPQCGVPGSKFKVVAEDDKLVFACEHEIGITDGVPAEIVEGLRANFTGECTEVGMYLAMSRQADREGYPEIAEAFKRYAWEEAEHASRFAELLGDVVCHTAFSSRPALSFRPTSFCISELPPCMTLPLSSI